MKKTLTLLILFFSFTACENYLDITPDERLTLDVAFTRKKYIENYLAGIYDYIPRSFQIWSSNLSPWSALTYEADETWNWYAPYSINIGNYGPSDSRIETWYHYYRGIRQCNIFLKNIDRALEIEEDYKQRYKGEALFLRGYFYFNLISIHGPVPIIDRVMEASDNGSLPRNTWDECVNFILKDWQEAEQLVPLRNTGSDWGFIDKCIIKAYRSRLLLYDASPFFDNNPNAAFRELANTDGTKLFRQTSKGSEGWKAAADAAYDLIRTGQFSLYRNPNVNKVIELQEIFYKTGSPGENPEMIHCLSNRGGMMDLSYHISPTSRAGGGGLVPTQRMVDLYYMKDGLPPALPGNYRMYPGYPLGFSQLYSEEGFSTEPDERTYTYENNTIPYTYEKTFAMWCNREPRFYAYIAFNGAPWWTWQGSNRCKRCNPRIETFHEGNDGKKIGQHDHSPTGYLWKKWLHPEVNVDGGNRREKNQSWVYVRLAEVYLNYIEALNEYKPGHADILKYLNEIRERAGIPPIAAGLGQSEMRTIIQYERRVELAMENLTYFDNKRWMAGEQWDGGPMEGMNINKGSRIDDPEFHKRTVFEVRVFDSKQYLHPIYRWEPERNPKLVQNPGW
jgi:hypothetical protein